ncbi:MAG: hypothetical protein M1485_01930 [Chloroflexi bacterium]|nr:hypothetical protein [Chloroflexota bacterium]
MRVVLDTNVFISAVLGGKLGVIVDEWKAGKFTLIITDSIARLQETCYPLGLQR